MMVVNKGSQQQSSTTALNKVCQQRSSKKGLRQWSSTRVFNNNCNNGRQQQSITTVVNNGCQRQSSTTTVDNKGCQIWFSTLVRMVYYTVCSAFLHQPLSLYSKPLPRWPTPRYVLMADHYGTVYFPTSLYCLVSKLQV